MTCRLFHDWGEWEAMYTPSLALAKLDIYGAIRREQQKTCNRCGRKKIRRI
jgi:ribosomal protein L37AE/L43A